MAKSFPLAYAQLGSELLTRVGVDKAVVELNGVVSGLGPRLNALVSRVDLCVDFLTDHHLASIADSDWVSRARSVHRWSVNRQFSGFSVGQGGSILFRLYDKTLEIGRSGKGWMYDVWSESGWLGELPVWRAEFQLRRQALRELGVETVADLDKRMHGLWDYCSTKWLRLADPSAHDQTSSRWATHPVWSALQSARFGEPFPCVVRRVTKARLPTNEYLFCNGLGAITSFMAKEGIRDVDVALALYARHARAYLRGRGGRNADLTSYARAKAAEKAKRFGLVYRRKADYSATDYLRAKYGEAEDE